MNRTADAECFQPQPDDGQADDTLLRELEELRIEWINDELATTEYEHWLWRHLVAP